ncbi:MAG: hypothetical protein KDC44_04550 [Phaeodactylibacter sp.]|nr:hypothetical protein [Phaeodactylibacter sp.]
MIKSWTFILTLFTCVASGQGLSTGSVAVNPDCTGLYLGWNAGLQNVFGGSFVNEMDVLTQELKFVTELFAGYRHSFWEQRFWLGLEAQLGSLKGDFFTKSIFNSASVACAWILETCRPISTWKIFLT